MKPGWLAVVVALTALLFARPGYCVDDELRHAAVDAVVARDAAQTEIESEQATALKAMKAWLATWASWETDLSAVQKQLEAAKPPVDDAIKALKARGAVPQDPGAKLTATELSTLSKALDTLKKALDDAQKALGAAPNAKLTEISAAIDKMKPLVDAQQTALDKREKALTDAQDKAKQTADAFAKGTGPARFLSERLRAGRQLRCITAYCYGGVDGSKFGIEPVLDLPVGLVWSAGSGALTSYVNSHTVNVEFNAGLRFWLGYDIMSVAVYFSRPLITGSDPIRVAGSSFEHTPEAVHRPFPSIGLGFAGDVLLLGISYDQLRNGATASTRDPSYPSNAVLSRSLTFSLGFSLFNLSKQTLAKSHDDSESDPTKGGTK